MPFLTNRMKKKIKKVKKVVKKKGVVKKKTKLLTPIKSRLENTKISISKLRLNQLIDTVIS